MKKVLVTGATGFLGQAVVDQLLKNGDYGVIAVGGRHQESLNKISAHPRLKLCSLDALFREKIVGIDTVVNCAFSRSNDSAQLAQSLDFTQHLIECLERNGAKSTINISSQGVYKRLPVGELSDEDSPIAPIDLYSMAKYATEKMFTMSSLPFVTNVRLASLMMPQRFLHFFVQKAMNGESFNLTAPKQYAALLDVSDAAKGVECIIGLDKEKRADTYNLGIGTQYSLLQYAESVKRVGESLGYSVEFGITDNGTETCAGMDNSRLMNDTGWKPLIMKDEMIMRLFHHM